LTFKKNTVLALQEGNTGTNVITTNCIGTFIGGPINVGGGCIANMTATWGSCYNAIAGTTSGFITKSLPWLNRFPNGTLKGFVSKETQDEIDLIVSRYPQFAYEEFCGRTTAGPNNDTCWSNETTIIDQGKTWKFPCEIFPSNNYYGFTVIYNGTTPTLAVLL